MLEITSLLTILIVVLVGSAFFNALLSYMTIASARVLQKTPEIDRGILSDLYRAKKKSDKYPWSGPIESSRLAVIVIWIIFSIGLALMVLGLFMTGRIQEYFFAFGIVAQVFSVAANLTASLFSWFVMGRIQDEKKKLENPVDETKKRKKRMTFFGISIEI